MAMKPKPVVPKQELAIAGQARDLLLGIYNRLDGYGLGVDPRKRDTLDGIIQRLERWGGL